MLKSRPRSSRRIREITAVIRDLQVQQRRLEKRVDRIYKGLSASIIYVFGELSK